MLNLAHWQTVVHFQPSMSKEKKNIYIYTHKKINYMNRAILVVLTDSEKTGTQMKDIKTNYSDYFFLGGGGGAHQKGSVASLKRG